MPTRPALASQRLAEAGRALGGNEWGEVVARVSGVHARTIRRIRAAAEAGEDYPAAPGALKGLAKGLRELADEIDPKTPTPPQA